MAVGKHQLQGLPGFYNESAGGHGFKGRHFYNPMTGEALSVRQGQKVQHGTIKLDEALAAQQKPLGTSTVVRPNTGATFKVTQFRYASGAYWYIKTHAVGQCYIVAYGWIWKPYEDEDNKGFRALTKMLPPKTFARTYTLEDIWKNQEQEFKGNSALRFYVWERIK